MRRGVDSVCVGGDSMHVGGDSMRVGGDSMCVGGDSTGVGGDSVYRRRLQTTFLMLYALCSVTSLRKVINSPSNKPR